MGKKTTFICTFAPHNGNISMNNSRSVFGGSIPPVTLNLIIINVIVWLAQWVFLRSGTDLTEIFGLHYIGSKGFRIYQLITYMFLHSPYSFGHVFFNMFAVFMFGRTLEYVWGSKRFLTYYLVTGVGAAIVQMLITFIRLELMKNNLSPDALNDIYTQGYSLLQQNMNYIDTAQASFNVVLNSVTVGASGAVFGILLAFGMLFPNAELFIIPIPFPIKAKWLVIGYGALELFLGMANLSGDNVAHFAHLGGMLFGIFMILYWKKKYKTNDRFY